MPRLRTALAALGARRRLPRSGGIRRRCDGQAAAPAPVRRLVAGHDREVRPRPGAARCRRISGVDGRRLPARRVPGLVSQPDRRHRGHRRPAPRAPGDGRPRLGGDRGIRQLHSLERLAAASSRRVPRSFCPNDWNRQRVDGSGPLTLAVPAVLRHQPVHARLGLGDRPGMGRRARQRGPVGAAAGRDVHREGLARPGVRGHVRRGGGRRVGDRHRPRRKRGQPCPPALRRPARAPQRAASRPRPAAARRHSTARPTPATMPDLIPLPAWGMGIDRQGGRDYLDFGATVWDAGPAPMDVEGFRRPGTNIMDAFQYFFRNGKPVGQGEGGDARVRQPPGPPALALPPVRPLLAPVGVEVAGRAQREGGLLPRADRRDRPDRPRRAVGSVLDRPRGAVRRRELDLDARDAAGRLGRHVLPVPPGPVVRHHRSEERHLLRRGAGQPAGRDPRDVDDQRRAAAQGRPGRHPGARTVHVPAWNGIDPE